MNRLWVWAPRARAVDAVIDGHRVPLERGEGGHFAIATELRPGTRYGFSLDGGPVRPDPRSRSQPDGVHGLSEVIDLSHFKWTDEAFISRPLASAIVYELHIGTFTTEGTFDAAIARLPHVVELGVTHVSVMPVSEFSGDRGWGYDAVDLFAVHRSYGGAQALCRFVDACHRAGLCVIIDVVYNHLGPSGNYLSEFGPYFTSSHRTLWGDGVNFDEGGSDGVRKYFLDNARMWLETFHFDGLRLDAIDAISNTSALPFLEELSKQTAGLGSRLRKHLVLIAESDLNDPRVTRSRDAFGFGLDAQWSDDFHHALHAWLTGERIGYYADFDGVWALARSLEQGYVYTGQYSMMRQHRHGRPFASMNGHKLLGFVQCHDQVGNRARGERMAMLVGLERMKVGLMLVLTAPFIPMLYSGDEWASVSPFQYFTHHDEPELAEAVRVGRRNQFAAFGWKPEEVPDPQAQETFEHSRLNWGELEKPEHRAVHGYVRALIDLRAKWADLRDGHLEQVQCTFDKEKAWLVVERNSAMVVANLGPAQKIPLPTKGERVVMASGEGIELLGKEIQMPENTSCVIERDAHAW